MSRGIVSLNSGSSSIKFALFFMAEYVNITVASALVATLFFGGWQVPFLDTETLIANAQQVVLGMLGGMALVSALLIIPTRKWNKTLARLYPNDLRKNEANFWAIVLLLHIVGALGGIGFFVANPITGTSAHVTAAVIQFLTFICKNANKERNAVSKAVQTLPETIAGRILELLRADSLPEGDVLDL